MEAQLPSKCEGVLPSSDWSFLWRSGGSITDCNGQGAHIELVDSLKVNVRCGE